jgi:hypothetical protein
MLSSQLLHVHPPECQHPAGPWQVARGAMGLCAASHGCNSNQGAGVEGRGSSSKQTHSVRIPTRVTCQAPPWSMNGCVWPHRARQGRLQSTSAHCSTTAHYILPCRTRRLHHTGNCKAAPLAQRTEQARSAAAVAAAAAASAGVPAWCPGGELRLVASCCTTGPPPVQPTFIMERLHELRQVRHSLPLVGELTRAGHHLQAHGSTGLLLPAGTTPGLPAPIHCSTGTPTSVPPTHSLLGMSSTDCSAECRHMELDAGTLARPTPPVLRIPGHTPAIPLDTNSPPTHGRCHHTHLQGLQHIDDVIQPASGHCQLLCCFAEVEL